MLDQSKANTEMEITMGKPRSRDGAAVWELIQDCDPLDENSMYCSTIQCEHFADTCVLATRDNEVVGWVSSYILPGDPETLFVWQVAVSGKARGQGLARRMLENLLERDGCAAVTRVQTTITRDNAASWALFTRFAEQRCAAIESKAHFKKDEHFHGEHATEHMVTISLPDPMRFAA